MHATIEDLAKAKGIGKAYVSQVLRLTLLAPEIVEAILDGRQPAELQLDDLLEGFPLEWEGQRKSLAISDPSIRGLRKRSRPRTCVPGAGRHGGQPGSRPPPVILPSRSMGSGNTMVETLSLAISFRAVK